MKQIVIIDHELKELIPGFLVNRQADIEIATNAVANKDYDTIRITGHTLKGIGGGYGFDRITDFGVILELSGKLQDEVLAKHILAKLKQYLETIEIRYE